jgi:hypothetical protein
MILAEMAGYPMPPPTSERLVAKCANAKHVPPGIQDVALEVRDQYAHHYADSILAHHTSFKTDLLAAISSVKELDFRLTEAGRFGVNTQTKEGLNYKLRAGFVERENWRAEIGWTDELPSPIWVFDPNDRFKPGASVSERFDLAYLDEHQNAKRIWNLVADSRRLSETQRALLKKLASSRIKAHWDGSCKCVLTAVRSAPTSEPWLAPVQSGVWTSQSLTLLINHTGFLPTLSLGPPAPTVLGEIQFGNWALAYRDVGRILAVRQKFADAPITLFIIIVATGCLADFISEGTVNFSQSKRTLERVGPDLPVPTWVVGIDFVHTAGVTHPSPS